MPLPLIGTASSLIGQVGTVRTLFGGATNTVSNLLGGTKGTCASLPSDAQLQHILASADPNEAPMSRTRDRFGRAATEGPMYAQGGHLNMAIYNAPISVVGNWARHDCESAGPIRQSLAADLQSLWSKYGGSFGTASAAGYGSAPSGGIQPIEYDSTGLTGTVQYDDTGGLTGGIRFGDGQREGTPVWMMIAFGVVVVIAIWAVITGKGGGTTGGLQ
jgi:hypothetical protein